MFTTQLLYHFKTGNKVMRIKTYLKILKILEGQLMRLTWHYLLVIIKETPINFETPFPKSIAGF